MGAIQIGNRDYGRPPKQETAGNMFGNLIDGTGGIKVFAAKRLEKGPDGHGAGQGVDDRIAEIDCHRIPPVLIENWLQSLFNLPEGLIPGRLLPLGSPSDERPAQTVRIIVEFSQGRPFGTKVTMAENILFIPLHTKDLFVFQGYL